MCSGANEEAHNGEAEKSVEISNFHLKNGF